MSETTNEDDFPPVRFSLRNMSGTSGEIELRTPMLGLDMYVLITPGDDAIQVEASHLDLNELIGALAVIVATGLQAEQVNDETREQAVDLIAAAVEEDAR